MQLSELLRLVRKIEPLAVRHRDHICSEAAAHDFGHCPKPPARVYAWRIANGPRVKTGKHRAVV
jgi:hypothetical protein